MAKMLVEIPFEGSAEDLMKDMEDNRKDWFVGQTNIITVDEGYLKKTKDGKFIFRLKGIIDEETDK